MNYGEINEALSRLGFKVVEKGCCIEVLDGNKSSKIFLNKVICGDKSLSTFIYAFIINRTRIARFRQAFIGIFDHQGNRLEPIKLTSPIHFIIIFLILSALLIWFIGNAVLLALSELALSTTLYFIQVLNIGRKCRRFRNRGLIIKLLRLSTRLDPSMKWELLEKPWKALSKANYIEYVAYSLDPSEIGVDICVANDNKVNAYVFPPYKLIIFTTSLLARLDPNEVKSVVIHELAHLKRFHGILSFILILSMVLGLVLAFTGSGMSIRNIIMLNVSLIGLAVVYSAALQGFEFDADRAVAKLGMSRDFSAALIKAAWNSILAEYILLRSSNIGRIVRFGIMRTHPTTIARLAKLVAKQAKNSQYEHC